ncbi:MAG TPA: DUF4381 family protein, partial [Phototrophicaceae bacterium]|nr:DUF4381 family protein [Phototrophicaceae bacterium]
LSLFTVGNLVPTLTQTENPTIPPPPTATATIVAADEIPTGQVTARFSTSNPRPLTGEAFTLELIISLPTGTELAELPTFPSPGVWGDFEIVQTGEVQTETQSDGAAIYRQLLTVRLWQPRDYVTPDSFVGYRLSGFNDVQRIPVRAENISIPTVLDFDDLTLRPFKALINLPYISPWLILGGLVIIGGGIGFGYHWWQRRPAQVLPAERMLTPGEIALQKLNGLKTSEEITPESQYTQVAIYLRDYVLAKYGIGEMTTAETVNALQLHLPEKLLSDLNRMLTEADLVKFAGTQSDAEVARRLIEAARRWINSVDQVSMETLATTVIQGQNTDADNSQ